MAVHASTHQPQVARDHGFHRVRIERVVQETADAASFVLDVPEELREAFAYEAGQFCTFRVPLDDGAHLRCYSMSSSPELDRELKVTVKRVPGGLVSNWMNDSLAAGDLVDVTAPAGVFTLGAASGSGHLVAFAAGSGITPVISLLKTALTTTDRPVRLLYANRDTDSTIFRLELDELRRAHGERFELVHHLDVDHGFVDEHSVGRVLDGLIDVDVYVCGPTPFMDVVERCALGGGVDAGRVHIERFTPAEPPTELEGAVDDADDDEAAPASVTIELDGRTDTTTHRPGTTILQTARQIGMSPPFSCESGSCATCMARLVEGSVQMRVNDALSDDEVAEGWILTCQSVPTSATVGVVYGFDD